MPISDKNRDYINKIRRELDNANHRDTGFNVSRQDDGMDALRQSVEAEEVKNENTPIYDDNDNDYAIFDNTHSIVSDDASLQYDEQSLGFDDGINDDDDGDIFDGTNNDHIPYDDGKTTRYSHDDIFAGIDDEEETDVDDVIKQLLFIKKKNGNAPCVVHINGKDFSISSIQYSPDGTIRIS